MEPSDLKLVPAPDPPSPPTVRRERAAAVSLGLLTLIAALAGTLVGADRARDAPRPIDTAREALFRVLDQGPSDPGVLELLGSLRLQIGQRPLDARTRALYAALLLEMAMGPQDWPAPAFHARRAANLAPVTVPVVRAAALVLARSKEPEAAVRLVHEMFGYDAGSAARLLTALEPFLEPGRIDSAIPANPDAWLAWAREIRDQGRADDADAWITRAHREWPDHLGIRQRVAARAVKRRDWSALVRVLPLEEELQESRDAALLLAFRARARAETGDAEGAHEDAEKAAILSGHSAAVLLHAGDALLAAGYPGGARRFWSRALFGISPRSGAGSTRIQLMVRMARFEDDYGKPAAALRAWKAVLEEDPEHALAQRRVADLGGLREP
jgi:tetratricopeptide (TPR) repeat protein